MIIYYTIQLINMYNHLSDDLLNIIFQYIKPSLNMLVLNRSSNKKYLKLLRHSLKYYKKIRQIYYLKAMRIKPTYDTLCYYNSYNKINTTLTSCEGYTSKGLRCNRKCKNRFCFQHEYTKKLLYKKRTITNLLN